MGAKGQRQGWQKHSIDEYNQYMNNEQYDITAPIDPEIMYPDEDTDWLDWMWETNYDHPISN